MKTADQHTDQTLASLDGMARATAPASLHQKVLGRIAALPKGRIIAIPRRTMWLVAAGLLLLLGTNFYVLSHKQSDHGGLAKGKDANPISAEYFQPAPSI